MAAIKERIQQNLMLIYNLVESLMKGKKITIPAITPIPWEPCTLFSTNKADTDSPNKDKDEVEVFNTAKRASNSKYKTLPCKWFHSGLGCERGDNCDYIHDYNFKGVQPPPHTYKHSRKTMQMGMKGVMTSPSMYPPNQNLPPNMQGKKIVSPVGTMINMQGKPLPMHMHMGQPIRGRYDGHHYNRGYGDDYRRAYKRDYQDDENPNWKEQEETDTEKVQPEESKDPEGEKPESMDEEGEEKKSDLPAEESEKETKPAAEESQTQELEEGQVSGFNSTAGRYYGYNQSHNRNYESGRDYYNRNYRRDYHNKRAFNDPYFTDEYSNNPEEFPNGQPPAYQQQTGNYYNDRGYYNNGYYYNNRRNYRHYDKGRGNWRNNNYRYGEYDDDYYEDYGEGNEEMDDTGDDAADATNKSQKDEGEKEDNQAGEQEESKDTKTDGEEDKNQEELNKNDDGKNEQSEESAKNDSGKGDNQQKSKRGEGRRDRGDKGDRDRFNNTGRYGPFGNKGRYNRGNYNYNQGSFGNNNENMPMQMMYNMPFINMMNNSFDMSALMQFANNLQNYTQNYQTSGQNSNQNSNEGDLPPKTNQNDQMDIEKIEEPQEQKIISNDSQDTKNYHTQRKNSDEKGSNSKSVEDNSKKKLKEKERNKDIEEDFEEEDDNGDGEEEQRDDERGEDDQGDEEGYDEQGRYHQNFNYGKSKENHDYNNRNAQYHQQQRMKFFNQQFIETLKKYPPEVFKMPFPAFFGMHSQGSPQGQMNNSSSPGQQPSGYQNINNIPLMNMMISQIFGQQLQPNSSNQPPFLPSGDQSATQFVQEMVEQRHEMPLERGEIPIINPKIDLNAMLTEDNNVKSVVNEKGNSASKSHKRSSYSNYNEGHSEVEQAIDIANKEEITDTSLGSGRMQPPLHHKSDNSEQEGSSNHPFTESQPDPPQQLEAGEVILPQETEEMLNELNDKPSRRTRSRRGKILKP